MQTVVNPSHLGVESLGESMRAEIQNYYQKARTVSPLLVGAREGHLTPRHVAEFLDNIFYLIQHTNIFLRLARRICLEKGLHQLGEFYSLKIDEEKGHERWAEADIEGLAKQFGAKPLRAVTPGMRKLVDSIRESIERDPTLYLCYIMLAEHFTVLCSPEFLSDLRDKCGIPLASMSVIGNHAELDKDHVLEMVEAIDRLAPEEKYRDLFQQRLKVHMGYHEAFCREIAEA